MTNEGYTRTERQLLKLARRSFLTLWSHANVFREDTGGNKELCDLLVIFEDRVIIFSDKDCAFSDSDYLIAWKRWFKRSIEKSCHQINNAEKIILNPGIKLYSDVRCLKEIPVKIPSGPIKIHRILTVHNTDEFSIKYPQNLKRRLGLDSRIIADAHYQSENVMRIGYPSRSDKFTHVFDDTSLSIVMDNLDTIADFFRYLDYKENLAKGHDIIAYREEDILADYISGGDLRCKFQNLIIFPYGSWEKILYSIDYHNYKKMIEESRYWDILIEKFTEQASNDEQYFKTPGGVSGIEIAVRWMAKADRSTRRYLSCLLMEFAHDESSLNKLNTRRTRVIEPLYPGGPYYIFLFLDSHGFNDYELYRQARFMYLKIYAAGLKARFGIGNLVIALGFDNPNGGDNSEDLVYIDNSNWHPVGNEKIYDDMKLLGIYQDPPKRSLAIVNYTGDTK